MKPNIILQEIQFHRTQIVKLNALLDKYDTEKNLDVIVNKVELYLGFQLGNLSQRNRSRNILWHRQALIYCIKKYRPSASLNMIGRAFGNLHHATIINSVKAVNDYIKCNDEVVTPIISKVEIAYYSVINDIE